jgi:hypothetical protein
MAYEDGSVAKRWHTKFRRQEITQNKTGKKSLASACIIQPVT